MGKEIQASAMQQGLIAMGLSEVNVPFGSQALSLEEERNHSQHPCSPSPSSQPSLPDADCPTWQSGGGEPQHWDPLHVKRDLMLCVHRAESRPRCAGQAAANS